jgi:metal-responsive CopG/Arc/MetJ family transcriptional regulator
MAKIAISIPDELLEAVEQERQSSGASRSQVFRRAVEEHLRRAREREDVQQYIRGYQRYPETRDERGVAESTLLYAFDEESWEEEFNR